MFPIRDSISYHGPSLMTKLLIGLNVLVFFWQMSEGVPGFQHSVELYGFVAEQFFSDPLGEGYTLLTSMFLHGSPAHILGNMWFLWVFGSTLEGRMGGARFLIFYLFSGVVAALAQGLLAPAPEIPMVGASGAISGVLGGYFVRFKSAYILTMVWIVLPFFFWIPAFIYLGYWAFFQFVYGLFGLPGIAWWAHFFGFVFGLVSVNYFVTKRRYRADPHWWDSSRRQ